MGKRLKMYLFGDFLLTDGENVLSEAVLHSAKLTRLLVYILMNRNVVLTHQKLIEEFWEDNTRNPAGALKNLMYRLRMALQELDNEQYICSMRGAYWWNPEIEVETDYERFEELNRQLRIPDITFEEKKRLCQEVIQCYRGNISPRLADEKWLLPRATGYQSVYMDIVKMLCKIYEEEGAWEAMEVTCHQALEVGSFDEDIHCWMIKSLQGQRKYDMAIAHYEKTGKLFYENMGIRTPEKLRMTFRKMMQDSGEYILDMSGLIDEMREQREPEEAYFCDYQIFRQVYRIEARRVERLGMAEYMVLLTVRRSGNIWRGLGVDPGVVEGMEILEKLLRKHLRIGDVVARYSKTQFIIMLPVCTYESAISVAERLKKRFEKSIGKLRLELLCELDEISGIR